MKKNSIVLTLCSLLLVGCTNQTKTFNNADVHQMSESTFLKEINPDNIILNSNYTYEIDYSGRQNLKTEFSYGKIKSTFIYPNHTSEMYFNVKENANKKQFDITTYEMNDLGGYQFYAETMNKTDFYSYFFGELSFLFSLKYNQFIYDKEEKAYIGENITVDNRQITKAVVKVLNNKFTYLEFNINGIGKCTMNITNHGKTVVELPDTKDNNPVFLSESDYVLYILTKLPKTYNTDTISVMIKTFKSNDYHSYTFNPVWMTSDDFMWTGYSEVEPTSDENKVIGFLQDRTFLCYANRMLPISESVDSFNSSHYFSFKDYYSEDNDLYESINRVFVERVLVEHPEYNELIIRRSYSFYSYSSKTEYEEEEGTSVSYEDFRNMNCVEEYRYFDGVLFSYTYTINENASYITDRNHDGVIERNNSFFENPTDSIFVRIIL